MSAPVLGRAAGTGPLAADPDLGAGHLEPVAVGRAHRHLVTKALAEFSHERLLTPEPAPGPAPGPADALGRTWWELGTPAGSRYRFAARVLPLEHWDVDPATVSRTVDGLPAPLDVLALVDELQPLLGLPDRLLGTYLEELSATLAGAAWKLHHRRADARALARADLQTVERSMTEGHPAFVANNGRIGFGVSDAAAYAPEAGAPVRLVWVAARREHTHLACGAGVDERSLYASQLGPGQLGRFADRLRGLGLDPADYLYVPVHPWQWEHRVAVTFAADLGRRDLVPVGTGEDRYQAQQSIRTFFDLDRPDRHYVKTALAVQNMGFLRGLSPAYMRATPAINDWVAGVVAGDPELGGSGFAVLRELASVGYTGDAYHRTAGRGTRSPYQRMVAALWRESPVPRLAPDERAMTMAALLHRDAEGRSLVGALVAGSGLPARAWFERYLDAYLRPVVHCLLAHDLAFMPHGENVILVLRGDVPSRALMKDVGEEVAVFGDRPLPGGVERVRVDYDDEVRLLSVFTDVFDGFLRHLVAVLDGDGLLDAGAAWRTVAACLAAHRDLHPALHRRFDLFTPRFRHSCLNRLQLRDTLQMVDLADQASSLQFAGTLANPVAPHRPDGA
ncbi:IucA/IucC family protein [Vallicoccus soli]|uniref:IucA/IucC family protein n=1 Tax=Vallicoccus soli TaxID=2339232 RepID=UPI0010598085|nr:IucA/IucC family protein [Vallicoccus soli]